ncbi:MAG: DUF4340 domain-containing protein [Phycisphaerae bacterium]
MNTKTTLLLAVVLVVLGGFYYYGMMVYTPLPGPVIGPPPVRGPSHVARDLLEEKLGDVAKIVCKRKGDEEWVFEKTAGTSDAGEDVWRMTSPLDVKCVKWEVDKISRGFDSLQYELSYRPGEPGAVTAAEAGLDPPELTVTMTDAEGETVTIEVGRPASGRETYVRLAGSEDICVGKSDLGNLIKDNALEYRDQQLWTFMPDDVTRVEIMDRSDIDNPVSYAFARDGARWMMESPVTAGATPKVDDMIRAMSRVRAIKWHDDDADRLATYGLKPAPLTVRATVEEAIPPEDEPEDEAESGEEATEASEVEQEPIEKESLKKVTVYELHLSDRSPIGEDTKTYVRIGDEPAVATLMKSTADKFKPVMPEWREMHITTVNVNTAKRIELTLPEGSATLVKQAGGWSFDGDGGGAEGSAVSDLLKAVGDLTAVVFIDEEPEDLASYGLDEPQAEIRLTIPGVEGVERITVGGYTDEATKRLVYVRRNELAPVGKVRRSDVAKLIQGPHIYRDRTIVDVLPSRFERIALSTENQFTGGRTEVTLEHSDDAWHMVEPVSAPVREDQINRLVDALGGLRAEQVVAEQGEPSAYGLHAPAVTVALTHRPPTEYRIEEAGDESSEDVGDMEEEGDKPRAAVPVEVQPPSETLELSVAEHDGKCYAKRSDRPTIYEVTKDFFKQFLAEYRTDRVMDFDDTLVRRLSIRHGDETHVFEKREDRWTYQPEPDLPLDSAKVENLVLQVRDVRTPRYVTYVAQNLDTYGLSNPFREVTVTLEDGTSHVLWVSDQLGDDGTDRGFYAAVKGRNDVLLLTAVSAKRFQVSLDELEESR